MIRLSKLVSLLVIALVLTTPALAADAASPTAQDGPALFEQLKSLVGEWRGEWMPGGAETIVRYSLTGKGSVLIEDYLVGSTKMQTMYHLDGDELMLTHYCSVANQPRMRLSTLSPDHRKLVFEMFDITNLSEDGGYSESLTLELIDEDRIAVTYLGAKAQATSGVTLQRVK